MRIIPTHSGIERYAKAFLLDYYYVLVIGWLAAIAVPLYFATSTNNFVALSSGIIGAGPFMLYYLYSEFHKIPWLDVPLKDIGAVWPGEEDEMSMFSIYADKKLLSDDDTVYPVIEIVAAVKNEGNATGKNCRARVLLDEGKETEHEFPTRWTGAQYRPEIDIDAAEVRELILFQLVPSPASVEPIEDTPAASGLDLDMTHFESLTTSTPDPNPLEISGYEFDVQRPMNPGYERSYHGQVDLTRLGEHRFIGYSIRCSREPNLKLKFFGEDFYRKRNLGTVSLIHAVRQSEWEYGPDRYSALRDEIDALFDEGA